MVGWIQFPTVGINSNFDSQLVSIQNQIRTQFWLSFEWDWNGNKEIHIQESIMKTVLLRRNILNRVTFCVSFLDFIFAYSRFLLRFLFLLTRLVNGRMASVGPSQFRSIESPLNEFQLPTEYPVSSRIATNLIFVKILILNWLAVSRSIQSLS